MGGRGFRSGGDSAYARYRLPACWRAEDGDFTEAHTSRHRVGRCAAGLAETMPLQSGQRLRVCFDREGWQATIVAVQCDVEAHPARRTSGWNREARSLARIPTLVRNTPERER